MNEIFVGDKKINIDVENNDANKEIIDKFKKRLEGMVLIDAETGEPNEKAQKIEIESMAITREEFSKLSSILEKQPPEGEEELKKFIEKQQSETITTREVLAGSSLERKLGGEKVMKVLGPIVEKAAYMHFEDKKLFENLNLSFDAKSNFSVGVNFYMLDFIATKIEEKGLGTSLQKLIGETFGEKEGEEGELKVVSIIKSLFSSENGALEFFGKLSGEYKDLADGFTEIFEEFAEKEGNLENLKKVLEELKLESNGEKKVEYGEKQAIFMNPLRAKELLEIVYNGASVEEIKKYIKDNNTEENKNFSDEDKKRLEEIGDKFGDAVIGENELDLADFVENLEKTALRFRENIKGSIENNKGLLKVLSLASQVPIIKEFVKMFLDFFGIGDIDKLFGEKSFEEKKKLISENMVGKGAIFEGKKIPEDFMKTEAGQADNLFLKEVSLLVGDKKGEEFDKGVKELFKNGGDFAKFATSEDLGDYSINLGEIDYKKLKKVLSLYRDFKLKKSENGELTVGDFMLEKNRTEEENEETLQKIIFLINGQSEASTEIQQEDSLESKKRLETQKENLLEIKKSLLQEKIQIIKSSLSQRLNNINESISDKQNKINNKNGFQKFFRKYIWSDGIEKEIKDLESQKGKVDKFIEEIEKIDFSEFNSEERLNELEKSLENMIKNINENISGLKFTEELTKIEEKYDKIRVEKQEEQQKKEHQQQQKSLSQETKEKLIVKGPEKLEIGDGKIEGVFNVGEKFYKLFLTQGKMAVIGDGKGKVYNCPQELIKTLGLFTGLDKKAEAKDFGKTIFGYSPKLGGKTVRDILIGGYKDKKGLKQLFAENFFEDGGFTKKATINFQGKDYSFDAKKS